MADDVIRETTVPAPLEQVWRSITEPEPLAEWLGEALELDLEPGGELRIRTAAGEERAGWIEDVSEPRRLSFWWASDGQDATRVELELEDVTEGTRIRVTESRPLAVLELRAAELLEGGGYGGGPMALARV